MKQVTLNDKNYNVKTTLEEINIAEFEQAISVFNSKELTQLDKHVQIISLLSNLTTDEVEELDLDTFQELIKEISINDFSNVDEGHLTPEIIVDDIHYKTKANGSEYKFTMKELMLLQKAIETNPNGYIIDLAAILFKEDDGTLLKESIEFRKSLFKDKITMATLSPYILTLSTYLEKQKSKV